MKKITFELLRGTLHLPSGTVLKDNGSTDDADTIAEIEALAAVKNASGQPQYVRILRGEAEAEVNSAVVKKPSKAETPKSEATAPAPRSGDGDKHAIKHPPGIHEAELTHTQAALEAAGLSFETANALSEKDIRAKTEGIGEGRIRLIRAVGQANGYTEFSE